MPTLKTPLLNSNEYSDSNTTIINADSNYHNTTTSGSQSSKRNGYVKSTHICDDIDDLNQYQDQDGRNYAQNHKNDAKKEDKFNPKFVTRFLPFSFYLVYILLTSMQELPMTSIAWILTNTTKLTPQELTIYYNLCFIPWTIKPLWGFLADNIPICGYRRKPYMIFFSILASVVFAGIPFFHHDKTMMKILGILQALCVVFSEVQIDGLVVALSNRLVSHQSTLYKHFPEFKLYVNRKDENDSEKEQKKQTKLLKKNSTNISTPLVLADNILHTNNHHPNNDINHNEIVNYVIHEPLLGPGHTHSDLEHQIDCDINNNDTTFQRKVLSSSSSLQQQQAKLNNDSDKYQLHCQQSSFNQEKKNQKLDETITPSTPEQIFITNPHYYDILTPDEYYLMLTKQPKASIQSEAMTFRTIASLISALVSLVLHLFFSPHHVVWISAGLPVLLVIVIVIFVPEKDQSVLEKFAQRVKILTAALLIHQSDAKTTSPRLLSAGKTMSLSTTDVINNDGDDDDQGSDKVHRFVDDCHCEDHVPERAKLVSSLSSRLSSCSHLNESMTPSSSSTTTSPLSSTQSTTLGNTTKSKTIDNSKEEEAEQSICFHCVCARIFATLNAIKLIWKPLLFMLTLRSMPTPTDPMMSYIFVYLTLPPWLLSGYSFISIAGGLLSSLVYWKLFVNIRLLPALIFFTIIAAIGSTATNLMLTTEWIDINIIHHHIPNWTKVFFAAFVGAIFSRLALMPTLILAAETSPQHFGLEATMFSIYTGVNNIGNVISVVGNLWLIHHLNITNEDFSGLPIMIMICGGASLLPLFFSPLIYCTQQDLVKLKEKEKEEEEKDFKNEHQEDQERNPFGGDDDNCHNDNVNNLNIDKTVYTQTYQDGTSIKLVEQRYTNTTNTALTSQHIIPITQQ